MQHGIDDEGLRALVDEMLQHVTAEQFLQCVIGREEGGAQ